MALKIGISTFVSGGFINPVRWDLHEAGPGGTTGVLVDSHTEAGPHGVVYNFAFTDNIKDINYLILFYDVPGGVGLGILKKAHEATPSTSTITGDEDIELIVDGGETYDPVGGNNTVVIPALHGKDFYIVQRSVGQLLQVRTPEFLWDDTTNTLTLTGTTFNPADTYFAKIRAKFIVNPPGSVSGSSVYKDILVKTVDYTVAPLDWGKLIIGDGVAPVITFQLGMIADIIAKIPLYIENIGSNSGHNNLVIQAGFGENIIAGGLSSNTFILSKGTGCMIMNVGGVLYGFTNDLDNKRRGQMEWGYYKGLNRLWADGTEYLSADYPGLKKAINLMPPGVVVDYTTWSSSSLVDGVSVYPYKGKYAVSGDTLHFKVPDWRNMNARALAFADTTVDTERVSQGPGGYQHYQIQSHGHDVATTGSDSGADPGRSIKRRPTVPDAYQTGAQPAQPYIKVTGGVETRGKGYGQIPLIIF